MCYSAEAWSLYDAYVKEFSADIDKKQFVRLYLDRDMASKKGAKAADTPKIPKGMDLGFLHPKTPDEQQIYDLITEYNAE